MKNNRREATQRKKKRRNGNNIEGESRLTYYNDVNDTNGSKNKIDLSATTQNWSFQYYVVYYDEHFLERLWGGPHKTRPSKKLSTGGRGS